MTYRFLTSNIWNYEFSPLHSGRALSTSFGICEYPWTETTIVMGMFTEFFGTFILVSNFVIYVFISSIFFLINLRIR